MGSQESYKIISLKGFFKDLEKTPSSIAHGHLSPGHQQGGPEHQQGGPEHQQGGPGHQQRDPLPKRFLA